MFLAGCIFVVRVRCRRKQFMFAILSPDEFLVSLSVPTKEKRHYKTSSIYYISPIRENSPPIQIQVK